ncbi:GxxExxY protein [Flavobacterium sp. 3HN19-14]|uniref:GxxExxY protein n=1 Tax=Flavobacterium sp. 3HN19-14 TaxID=3448133 RepID=UPI003EDEE479
MNDFYLRDEAYAIIGCCMEVHKILGNGHGEIIYGDALEYEFQKNDIPYSRKKQFSIAYKDIVLPHYHFSDFLIFDKIILEIKAISKLSNNEIRQTLNYLAASKNKLGLLVNFGESSLVYKRVIL